jgi:hypothetical protein
MAPLPLGVEVSISAVPEMTRVSPSRRWAPLSPGAVFALMAWMLFAPSDVQAGCSHLVTSRTDRTLLPLFLQDVMPDQGNHASAPSLPLSMPESPRPCRGAWCADGPAVPAAPSGTVSLRAELWAWSTAMPDPDSATPSRLIEDAADLHPRRRATPTFRPPRLSVRVTADRPIESRWIRSPGRALQRTPATSSAARPGLDSGPRP